MKATIPWIWGGSLVLALAAVLGYAGRVWWRFELLSHFRLQYFVLLLLLALLFIRLNRVMAVFLGSLAFVSFLSLLPFFWCDKTADAHQKKGNFRIMSANVHFSNQEQGRLISEVDDHDPDILLLLEATEVWRDTIAGLRKRFKAVHFESGRSPFSIALFSRYPLECLEVKRFGSESVYGLVVRVEGPTGPFLVIGAHTLRPSRRGYFDIRNAHLADLALTARARKEPVILAGDLNISPWSPYFRSFVEESGLFDARKGHGFVNTWPVGYPPARIPIDHLLTSEDIVVRDFQRGKDIGSDHFPVIVDLSL